jgi:hypothetical protein
VALTGRLSQGKLTLPGRHPQAVMVMVREIQRRIHGGGAKHRRGRRHKLRRRHGVELRVVAGHSAAATGTVMMTAHGGRHTGHGKGRPAVPSAAARAVQTRRRRKKTAERLMVVVMAFLLGLGGELAVPRLDVLLLEGGGAGDVVQLVVEAARVADRFAVGVATPQRRGVGAAVRAARSLPFRRGLNRKVNCYGNKVHINKEYFSVCPLVGIRTLPLPLSPASVPLPPRRNQRGMGVHSPAGEGLGEPQFGRLEKSLALCLLCGYGEEKYENVWRAP